MSAWLREEDASRVRYTRTFGVNHLLVMCVVNALVEFNARHGEEEAVVTEGLRTVERQRQLVRSGASRTMSSLHLEGRALDIAVLKGGRVVGDVEPHYAEIAALVQKQAAIFGVNVEWGGNWRTFQDGCHFQI